MAAHLSIVLVEDNDDLREITADALRAEGHRVVALSCAEELEDHAAGAAADVFLVDLNLPGEDGFSPRAAFGRHTRWSASSSFRPDQICKTK